ncbi:hypothetical protein DID88_005188 [Monilinia fructigena]|uniref:Methylated-DNA--protein-cysteine methyltransferase n=1 Tax=Monilinia fructigena TaxID=38457 RepID=A0A395IEZ4_9HELO|nr:hypothetical protein DID88_005188 [Monilinia fructigena]
MTSSSQFNDFAMSGITDFQRKVYILLLQIPSGKVSSYASLAKALSTAPRAVGGALKRKSLCTAGAFRLEDSRVKRKIAPSKINQQEKLELLKSEGVEFDSNGQLVDRERWWEEFHV